jgi:hypothetical protein
MTTVDSGSSPGPSLGPVPVSHPHPHPHPPRPRPGAGSIYLVSMSECMRVEYTNYGQVVQIFPSLQDRAELR